MAPRTLPGLGLSGFWTLGEDGWKDAMDYNLLLLSAITQGKAISRVTALPGSPTDGDIYIVPAAAGAHPDEIAVRDNGAWVYIVPVEGDKMWVNNENIYVVYDGADWKPMAAGKFIMSMFFPGAPTNVDGVMMRVKMDTAVVFEDDFAGSLLDTLGIAAADAVYKIQKNGVDVCTITVVATQDDGTFVSSGAISYAVGDFLAVLAPSPADVTLSGTSLTLVGRRSA